jgi:hypothetical protein
MCISNSRFTFDVSRFTFDVLCTTLHLKKVHGYITFEEGARLQMLHLKKVHKCPPGHHIKHTSVVLAS